jgi:primosomal protein N''
MGLPAKESREPESAPENSNALTREQLNDQRFERLLVALERLVGIETRKAARESDAAKRAAKKAGPTTDRAMADVEARLKRRGSR